jgi:hypothetical protein
MRRYLFFLWEDNACRWANLTVREKKQTGALDASICVGALVGPGIGRESNETARKKILSALSKRPVVHALRISNESYMLFAANYYL